MSNVDIQPLEALTLAGHRAVRHGQRLVAECPSCEGTLDIVNGAFLCDNSGCRFSRGGGIDYLACCFGSYSEAIQVAGEVSPYFADAGESEVTSQQNRRDILDFFIRMESQSSSADVERLNLRQEFTRYTNIPSNAFSRGHLYLTEKDSNDLVMLLSMIDTIVPTNLHNKPNIVIPYWSYPHVLSHLGVTNPSKGTIKSCEVFPNRYSWFGLIQKHPDCKKVAIFPEYMAAMAQEEAFGIHSPDVFPTSLLVSVRHPSSGLTMPEMTFHGNDKTWVPTLAQWSFAENFDQSRFHDDVAGTMNLPDLMELTLKRALVSGYDAFLDLCGGMNMDGATRSRLMMLAVGIHDPMRSRSLRNTLTRKLIEKGDKYSLFESADGYELVAPGGPRQISNFTLSFQSAVIFSKILQQRYQGSMVVCGKSIPIDIPGSALETPQALEKELQNIQNLSPGGLEIPNATVRHRTDFRKVLTWLRNKAADLPRSHGFNTLGWSRRCDTFITPDLLIDEVGIHTGVRYYPDEMGDHRCYTSGTTLLPVPKEMPGVDPEFAGLIGGLLSQVIRFFHGHKVRAIGIRNTVANRERALILFAGFGQHSLLRLTNILPRNIEINRGMPCVISGLNELQADKLQIAGLWLADKGFDLASVPDDQIRSAGSYLPAMVAETVHKLMNGNLGSFKERRSVSIHTGQAVEGCEVIRGEYWPEWPSAGVEWSAIDTVLDHREKDFKLKVRVDEANSLVSLPPDLWSDLGFNRTDLVFELGQLCATLDTTGQDQAIVTDMDSMYRLLGDFYGQVPKLRKVEA